MPPIPSALAILICDQVIIDAETAKKTVVGIFDSIWMQAFPAIQKLGFYARLTDLEGEYKFSLRVVRLTGDETVICGLETKPVSASNRLAIMELALNLPPVPFQCPGQYEFQLYANDEYIGRSLFNVGLISELQQKRGGA
jgi:Family of unknown function (DUF6941)